ncbi:MAG TPA: Ig-like domain repeat protein [Terracidiphilus sp.]|nr:Ig-like domain repeat protein [Terracidiphilus sp.]
MSLRWAFVCAAVLGLMGATCGLSAEAQTAATRPIARITAQVDEGALATLKGNTSPIAQAAYDHGAAPVSMPANRLVLVLKRSKQQEADLQTYLEAVQDTNSPSYHKFLTPEQFGQRYGVSDADLAVIETWLEGHGLKVDRVEKGRLALEISGTVGQVESTFHTSIHSFVVKGQQYWANAVDPEIPAALMPVVAGVASLNSVKPKAAYRRGPSGVFDPLTGTIRPSYTIGDTTNGYTIFLGPADAATIYDTPTSLNPAHTGTAYDGTGVTIALAGDSNVSAAQVANYRSTFGLPAKALQVVTDGADPGANGDEIEAYLDTEVATGIAPNANVILYTAADTTYEGGLFLAIQRALDDNQADILSVSFSECESDLGTSGNLYMDELWQQAAAQGIAVLVASGDSGSAECDDPHTENAAQYGLAVNGLSSTPYNISVGGTDFDALYSNGLTSFENYVDLTNTLPNHRSAKSYIPEEPWNDAVYPNTSISQNEPLSDYGVPNDIVAAGGGISTVYPTPSWQSGFGSMAGRNLPDVSFLAGNGFYGAVWALCTDLDSDANGNPITDCAPGATGNNFNVTGVGGTSAASPAFAGMLALVEQKTGSRLGQADYVLYKLAKSKYSTVFHDVSSGDNSVPCISGTPNCALNGVSQYFLTGYNATTGYDEASGLGSVDATQMANNWASAGLTATSSTLQLNGGTAALNITHGQGVTVAGTVTGSGGTPTGLMGLVDDLSPASYPGQEAIATFSMSGGAISGTTNVLPGGSYHVSAHYGGDATFAQSDSNAIQVTVGAETSTTSLTATYYDPSTGNQASTPYYGYIYSLDAQPYGNSASLANPDGAATGTVTFKSGTATLGTAQLSSAGVAELQTGMVPVGTDSLTAAFPGDASFNASTSSAVSLTVLPVATFVAVNASGAYINVGDSETLSAKIVSANNIGLLESAGVAPTGSVTFTDGTTNWTVPVTGTAGTSTSLATGSATYTTTQLSAGGHTISGKYSGDTNYAASQLSGSYPIEVNGATAAMTVSPASSTIQVNQPELITVTLAGSGSYPTPTGTVKLVVYNGSSPAYTSAAAALVNGAVTITVPANTLPLGQLDVNAIYSGDHYYNSGNAGASFLVVSDGTVAPTVTVVTPSGVVNYPVTFSVNVTGPSGDPTPTGNVAMSTGQKSLGTLALTNGSASTFLAGVLQPGPNTLTANYYGDSTYKSGTGTATVTLIAPANVAFSTYVAVFAANSPEPITVTVQTVQNVATPTGTIDVSGGGYDSGPLQLSGGSASFTIPASTFTAGSYTLTAAYSGNADYSPGTALAYIVVTAPVPAGISLTGTNVTISSPGATTNNTSTITVTPAGGFTGSVAMTASITSSPSGATYLPALSFGSTSPVTISDTNAATATMAVTTTAATTGALREPGRPGAGWMAGGATLACLLLFGIPGGERRRRWRQLLGMVMLAAALGLGVSSCGGGSSVGGGGGGGGIAGTTPGTYTATVTGAGGTISAQTTVTITVQ